MAKADDIQERLVGLAAEAIKICDALPPERAGGHIAGQLLRSATSGAANYAEARGAESNNDFLHKLKLVLKELNETLVWLDLVGRSEMIPKERLAPVQEECRVLCRIIAASITTVKRKCEG